MIHILDTGDMKAFLYEYVWKPSPIKWFNISLWIYFIYFFLEKAAYIYDIEVGHACCRFILLLTTYLVLKEAEKTSNNLPLNGNFVKTSMYLFNKLFLNSSSVGDWHHGPRKGELNLLLLKR